MDRAISLASAGGAQEVCFEENLLTLLPAFLLSELKSAFVIGYTVYLPFLVVDLLVSHLLLALGMTMTSPHTIALPIKLFLFVASNGWYELSRSLVLSYG